MQGHALGVDLGTSNTVAVLRWPDGRTRPLLFDGQPLLPSGVLLDDAGRLHVGRDAQRLAQADPARYEPNPKRHVDAPAVLLGDREVATVDLLAAILAAVAHAAVEAAGYLPPAAVTYPAAWGATRRQVLSVALSRAGWPASTVLVPEPVAAARYFAEVLRRPVPVGSALAVFDFGGGTLDIAVVRNDGPDPSGRVSFSVVSAGGVAELGGLDLDAALVDHLGHGLAGIDPAAWERLRNPANTAQWRDRRRFWDDVRGAKEMLSRAAVAPVAVPGVEKAVHLTRDELEQLATPLLRRGVIETAGVITAAALRPDQLAGLFLVGGSSRVPLVARMLHADLGLAPTVLEQPELPVAEGALAELPAAVAVAATAPSAAGTARVTSAPPEVSPVSGGAAPPPPVPPQRDSAWVAPTAGPPRSRRGLVVSAAAAGLVLIVAAVAVIVMLVNRDGFDKVKFAAFADVGSPLGMEATSYYVWSHVAGDRAYFAYTIDDKLTVVAADATNGKQLWRETLPDAASTWEGIRAVPGAVLAYANPIGSTEPRRVFVLDPGDGHRLWDRNLGDEDETFVVEDRLVVVDRVNAKLVGLALRDGVQKWEQPTPKDQYDDADTAVYGAQTVKDLNGPADFGGVALDPDRTDDKRLVQINSDRSARVIDAVSGEILKQQAAVADPNDLATVFDGQLFTTRGNDSTELFAVDLDTFDKPRLVYRADPQRRPTGISPCGDQRVCLLEQTNFDSKSTELVSLPTGGEGEKWTKPAAGVTAILPVGDHVVLQSKEASVPHVVAYDADGVEVLTHDGAVARVNGASVLIFGKDPGTSVDDVNVVGWVLGEQDPVQLGALSGVRPASCTWSTSVVACVGDKDLRVRRFAG
ncbi:Hsp70 family protein [Asanoa sp. WMMD1127]|uniref:hsp70 family protein n=1 Tax=Asanoa sp. WMMD1127 TaxID=3016107 RepID=UPI0024166611|nr:hsp70 family protein [Asanoa sp. WMMD1127]MDG4822481.1 Hsp70 family protein [Asanoa sp. WMMD1127]